MSKYLPSEHFEIEFEGDIVSFDVESLDQADFFKLLPFFHKDEDGETKLRFNDRLKFMEMSGELLGKYVKEFDGLKDAEGKGIPLSTVSKKTYFITLSQEIIGKLFEVSRLSGEDEKKLGEQSEVVSTESGNETI